MPELALECLSAVLLERNQCIAGSRTDPAGGWVTHISGLSSKCAVPFHISQDLCHRNVMETCMFCEGIFNSIAL